MTKQGIAVSGGIGMGRAFVLTEQTVVFSEKAENSSEQENERLQQALEAFCREAEQKAETVRQTVGEQEAKIITGHAAMLRDPYLISECRKRIDRGESAEFAFHNAMAGFEKTFSVSEDEKVRQRAADIRDLQNSVLRMLTGGERSEQNRFSQETVVVAKELPPSVAATLDREKTVGIVTETGGKTSHSAILANSMGIPAVLSVQGGIGDIKTGDFILVDGEEGRVTVNPDSETLNRYRERSRQARIDRQDEQGFLHKPTVTASGERRLTACNIGTVRDIDAAVQNGGEEIGLFRTEFLFMDRLAAPSEQEQFEAYRAAAEAMQGRPVTVRTLDVGGDKEIPYLGLPKEENPFLGFRAIRYCLKNRALFRTQLRALLRAGVYGDIRVMLPFVISPDELRQTKALLRECERELKAEGTAYREGMKLGVMIETPAAVLTADSLAQEADFFSIGTNDLIQYVLAADRGNSAVEALYSVYHPAVLRAICHVIDCAKKVGIPVGMCGEAAADGRLIPLLLGFGLEEFSVNPSAVLKTRRLISRWSLDRAKALAQQALTLRTEEEIVALLDQSTL